MLKLLKKNCAEFNKELSASKNSSFPKATIYQSICFLPLNPLVTFATFYMMQLYCSHHLAIAEKLTNKKIHVNISAVPLHMQKQGDMYLPKGRPSYKGSVLGFEVHYPLSPILKVHKIEIFLDSDFGICFISFLVMSKY